MQTRRIVGDTGPRSSSRSAIPRVSHGGAAQRHWRPADPPWESGEGQWDGRHQCQTWGFLPVSTRPHASICCLVRLQIPLRVCKSRSQALSSRSGIGHRSPRSCRTAPFWPRLLVTPHPWMQSGVFKHLAGAPARGARNGWAATKSQCYPMDAPSQRPCMHVIGGHPGCHPSNGTMQDPGYKERADPRVWASTSCALLSRLVTRHILSIRVAHGLSVTVASPVFSLTKAIFPRVIAIAHGCHHVG